ncbi:hypothetical protein J113_13875 [Mycobacterium tuberculosis CAS/NITR204]|uniref:PIN domain-containing protein n=1 Tax=Mycobacterium tuberculosis CAS/NITR204 TaxID=1310114 RepID=R4M9I5_MYCTX|nr:hypothetical protein J113_13875 [Mycobacterium tuberculosis CAS/NITR204]
MIVDTSVWIAYLSTSESLASRWLADRIAADSTVIVPEVVMMELLIGKTDEDTAALRRRLLQRFAIEPLAPVRDAEDAAAITSLSSRRRHRTQPDRLPGGRDGVADRGRRGAS